MANRSKYKKGEGAGFSWIIAIIVLILSAGVILWALQASSAKADEKSQVELCRVSNEIKVGVEHRTKEIVSTPRFCSVVDKTSGKQLVPTKNYPQKPEGASMEVRDMIKNCWYMWLDGAEPDIFRLYYDEKLCRICYKFKIKDGIGSLNLTEIGKKLQEPYFASDTSDKCNPPNGGFLRSGTVTVTVNDPCVAAENPDETYTGKKVGSKYCCRKDLINECYNKGGQCLESPSPSYVFKYLKWACPSELTCYVNPSNIVSYIEYITELSPLGGDLIIKHPDPSAPLEDLAYTKDVKYAISFISFSEQSPDVLILGKVLGGQLISVEKPGGGIIQVLRRKFIDIIPWFKDVPNQMMLSTYDQAQEAGCREE